MSRSFRRLALAALGSASLAAALPAQAGDVAWSITLGGPGFALSAGSPWAGPRFAPAPIVHAPAPVIVAPRPRFVAPSPWAGPVFVPGPVVAGPAFVPGPVFAGPPVVRRGPPRVVVVAPVARPPRAHPRRVVVPAPVIVAPGPRW